MWTLKGDHSSFDIALRSYNLKHNKHCSLDLLPGCLYNSPLNNFEAAMSSAPSIPEVHGAYIQRTLNPVIESLVTDLIVNKPADVLLYMHTWLAERHPSMTLTKAEKAELKRLKRRFQRLQAKVKVKAKSNESVSASSDDEDDYIDEMPAMSLRASNSRTSVSAEAFGVWNKKEDFKPRVIPKSAEQKAQIAERLSRSFMFSALEDTERDVVIDAMEERTANPEEYVIQQGQDGHELFVVDSGRLACSKVFKESQDQTFLKHYEPGDTFGELALLYNAPRAASIKAETLSKLWVLDRGTFSHIVKDAAMRKRERYDNLLKRVELLENMDTYERSQLSDAFQPVSFAAGDYVITEGEQGELFYIIESGAAVAMKILEAGQPAQKVKPYTEGEYFGELALLRGEPRAASIVAETDLKCVTLDRQAFKRLLGPLDDILRRNASKYEGYLMS